MSRPDRIALAAFFVGAALVPVALFGFVPSEGAGLAALAPALIAPLILLILAGSGLTSVGRAGGPLHTAMRTVALALAGIFAASTSCLLYLWVR